MDKNGIKHKEVWIDRNGDFHYCIPALLDALDLPQDEEHQCLLENILGRFLEENFSAAPIIYIRCCPDCGVSGNEPHAKSCGYIDRMGG